MTSFPLILCRAKYDIFFALFWSLHAQADTQLCVTFRVFKTCFGFTRTIKQLIFKVDKKDRQTEVYAQKCMPLAAL